MKKRFIVGLLFVLTLAGVSAQTVNSKEGYQKLKWGTSVADAKKAGYELVILPQEQKNILLGLFTEDVDIYSVVSKDKRVENVTFYYYMGRLFYIFETLIDGSTQKKIEDRYGSFKERGMITSQNQILDPIIDTNGTFNSLSIIMTPSDSKTYSVFMMDWNVYKNISILGRKLSGQENSIVSSLSKLAEKLVQEGYGSSKPSYAFIAFTSDNKNSAFDNYVTDALTEAAFETGKIRIMERANLEKILTEQRFQSSGLVNEETAKAIGNIAGVDYVCYGTIKDIGDQITVNARVVDVESGEICAMSRDTVAKDDYLKSNGSIATNRSSATSSVAKKAPENCLWQVRKSRNEFDGYTTYTFTLKGPNEERGIMLGYDKNDVSSKSIVRSGFFWDGSDCYGAYDIKKDDGSVVNKEFRYENWSWDTGWKDGKEKFWFSYNKGESARFMLELIEVSEFVTVRHRGSVQRFQPSGFWDYLESQGITQQEIYDAIANEEF